MSATFAPDQGPRDGKPVQYGRYAANVEERRGTPGRPSRPRPRDLAHGWPDTPLDDHAAEVQRQLVLNLRAAAPGLSTRAIATAAGVHHSVVADLLAGNGYPDTATLARLEQALDTALWPAHRPRN